MAISIERLVAFKDAVQTCAQEAQALASETGDRWMWAVASVLMFLAAQVESPNTDAAGRVALAAGMEALGEVERIKKEMAEGRGLAN